MILALWGITVFVRKENAYVIYVFGVVDQRNETMNYINNNIEIIKKIMPKKAYPNVHKLCDEIDAIYKEYNNGIVRYTDNYKKTMETAFDKLNIDNLVRKDKYGEIDSCIDDKRLVQAVTEYLAQLNTLKYLRFLSEDKKSVVLVGPNGSGKTTLLRQLIRSTGEKRIGYYAADRLYVVNVDYKPQRDFKAFVDTCESHDREAINLNNVSRSQYISNQINQTIALFEKIHAQESDRIISGRLSKNESKTFQIIKTWNNLIPERKLYSDGTLRVQTNEGKEYSIEYLSSGEKSILYFLSSILLKETKEFYFVDEPENNLNPSIVARLWNIIEKQKPDSVFVYLTHDSCFVASRINSKVYWIEGYDGTTWKYKPLPQNDEMPQELMISLVGNRLPVLFCESHDEYKLDDRVFKMMFPEFKIVAAGGCDAVIKKVKAYKVVGLPQKAYGIIDCDYKEEDYLRGQEREGIYHLPFFEIENLLICEIIVKGIIKEYSSEPENAFQNLKDALKTDFISKKERWIIRKTGFKLRDIFFNKKINSLTAFEDLKKEYNDFLSQVDLDAMRVEYEKRYDEIINSDDYDTYLRYYDNKAILKNFVHFLKLKNNIQYEDVVFAYLENNQRILADIRKKYLPVIK